MTGVKGCEVEQSIRIKGNAKLDFPCVPWFLFSAEDGAWLEESDLAPEGWPGRSAHGQVHVWHIACTCPCAERPGHLPTPPICPSWHSIGGRLSCSLSSLPVLVARYRQPIPGLPADFCVL